MENRITFYTANGNPIAAFVADLSSLKDKDTAIEFLEAVDELLAPLMMDFMVNYDNSSTDSTDEDEL